MSNQQGNGAKPPPKIGRKAGDVVESGAPKVLHLARPIRGPAGRCFKSLVEADNGDLRVQWHMTAIPAQGIPVPMLELVMIGRDGKGVSHLIPIHNVASIEIGVRRLAVDEPAHDPLVMVGR